MALLKQTEPGTLLHLLIMDHLVGTRPLVLKMLKEDLSKDLIFDLFVRSNERIIQGLDATSADK